MHADRADEVLSVLEPFAPMLLRTDAALYGLPHPKLAKILKVPEILEAVVGVRGVQVLKEVFKDLTQTKSQLVQEGCVVVPQLRELSALCANPKILDFAHLELFLAPLRFWSNGGRLFEVDQELDALLALTDIGDSAPMHYFRLPFPVTYFLFGAHGGGLKLSAPQSGESLILGAYVTELCGVADAGEFAAYSDWAGPNREITCYDITFISRPVRFVADLGTAFIRLYVGPKMRDLTVAEVLALNFKVSDERKTLGANLETQAQLRAGLGHLAKVLLHLNTEGAVQRVMNEESELAQRLKGVKAKKIDKLRRRLERTYDRIVITHQRGLERDGGLTHSRSPRTHWRRGHFRHQSFGPGRTQSKLRWIQPMLIGHLTARETESRDYAVKLPGAKQEP
jgi:hypothetical protein